MDETQTVQSSGKPSTQVTNALDHYDQLASPEFAAHFDARIEEERQLFNYEQEFAAIESKRSAVMADIDPILANDKLSELEVTEALQAINGELDVLDFREKEVNYLNDFMRNRENQRRSHGTMLFGSFEPDVQPLITSIVNAAQMEETEFIPEEKFAAAIDAAGLSIDVDAARAPIEVPLSSIVSAVGFLSWEGNGDTTDKKGKASSEIIQEYATLPTDIPLIDAAKALILPDGKVIIMTHDSHRVAAAKLKGQRSIAIKYLEIRKAKYSPVHADETTS
jgi:hypothetical protein